DVEFRSSGGALTKKVHYTYDLFDRLIGKQVDSDGNGTYDAAQWYASDQAAPPLSEGGPQSMPPLGKGGSGGAAPQRDIDASNLDATLLVFDASGSLTTRYLSGPAVDQVFADENALGTILWDLADNAGTIRDVVQYNSGTNTARQSG